MTLQQMRYLCEIVDKHFNISNAAAALFTSQPGISKQIRLLEEELGTEILLRRHNRIIGLTDPGVHIVEIARRFLVNSRDLREIATEFTKRDSGRLAVATTHLHARYPLLPVIRGLSKKYPNVHLSLFQGSPAQIAEQLTLGEADIGISTECNRPMSDCVKLDAYPLYRSLIAPIGHPILKLRRPSLKEIAKFPLVVYDSSFTSGWTVRQAFEKKRITPNVVLNATDADVIKAYVAAGLGIAVLQQLAYDPRKDVDIRAVSVDHLFAPATTYLLLRRGKFLRHYMFEFIAMISAKWTRARVEQMLHPTKNYVVH